jgi:hypothetical protein
VRALLIGTNFYRPGGPWPSLSGCVRDAGRMEDFLRHVLGVPADRIRKLTASAPLDGGSEPPEPPEDRPTYGNMVAELLRLAREAAPGEQVLIYFAGHGGRLPTCIPEVRHTGVDEVLLPYDAAAPATRCLRDVEVGAILRSLLDRQALVTLVLDCCHAGAANRLLEVPPEIGVRGSGVVDGRPRPMDSLVAPRPSLAALWRSLDAGPERNLTLGSGWQPDPRGYVLLAACRSSEIAFELPFEGREKRGVFTHALLEGLRHLAPGLTYRRLYDRIVAEVHNRLEQQTPVLEGDEDRVVFGDRSVREPPAVNVLRVERGGKRLLLETGRAQGIERRARFTIHGDAAAPLAVAQVTMAGSTESWSRIVESVRPDSLAAGLRAYPQEAGALGVRRTVRLLRAPSQQAQTTMDAVEKILEQGGGRGFLRLARAGEGADFLVAANALGRCEIQDPAGTPLPNLPQPAASGSGAAQLLIDLLVHLAKFRNVQRLVNRDRRSPLRGALVVEAGRPPKDWSPGKPVVFTEAKPVRRVRCGQWIWVRLHNAAAQELSLGVLDVQPDWGVSLLLPAPHSGDSVPLGPGGERVVPLQVQLPRGLQKGTDLLKVVAAVGRIGFRWLELQELASGSPRAILRGGTRPPADDLEALFAALTADRPAKRSREPSRYPGREWTVAHLEIEVVR